VGCGNPAENANEARKTVEMSDIPKVDQKDFEKVVQSLLKQGPTKRSEIKSSPKKLGKVIPPRGSE
jgi:hypothetical protein